MQAYRLDLEERIHNRYFSFEMQRLTQQWEQPELVQERVADLMEELNETIDKLPMNQALALWNLLAEADRVGPTAAQQLERV